MTGFVDCALYYYYNGTDCINPQIYFENLLDWRMDLLIFGIPLFAGFILWYYLSSYSWRNAKLT